MATKARLLVLMTLLASAAARKNGDTLVFATFGDWGWSPIGANTTMLIDSSAQACYALIGNAAALKAQNCIGNQGYYVLAGYAQLSQNGTANAMGAACTAAGGCDFLLNTGDSFYDLGIVNGVNDPQWQYAFQNVFNAAGIPSGTPILGTLGNHDYSPWFPTMAASMVAYTGVDPSKRWYLPQRGTYSRTFTSASGATSINVVQMDSTVLHDRYIIGGSSGGGYATGLSGKDTVSGSTGKINSPGTGIVLNPSVTAANGFSGNLYNASNFACTYDFVANAGVNAPPQGYASGCKYASPEFGAYASPAGRAAAYANATAAFTAGLFKSQHAVLFSHFPILSSEQRLTPWYDSATAMLSTLGSAAPQVFYNGHDHSNVFMSNPNIVAATASGAPNPIGFYTSGSAGVPEYGYAPPGGVSEYGYSGANAMPTGYATGSAAVTAVSTTYPYSAQPLSGTATTQTKYNPDVGFTSFWSGWSGFVLNTVTPTSWRADIYLINCTLQYLGQPCTNTIGPLYSQTYPARPTLPVGTPSGAAVTVTASVNTPTCMFPSDTTTLRAVLAPVLGANTAASAVATTPGSSGSILTVSIPTTAGAAGTVGVTLSTAVTNGALAAALANPFCYGAAPTITFASMPVATLAGASAASRSFSGAFVALAAAAIMTLAW